MVKQIMVEQSYFAEIFSILVVVILSQEAAGLKDLLHPKIPP